jgi:hypothetical protein
VRGDMALEILFAAEEAKAVLDLPLDAKVGRLRTPRQFVGWENERPGALGGSWTESGDNEEG